MIREGVLAQDNAEGLVISAAQASGLSAVEARTAFRSVSYIIVILIYIRRASYFSQPSSTTWAGAERLKIGAKPQDASLVGAQLHGASRKDAQFQGTPLAFRRGCRERHSSTRSCKVRHSMMGSCKRAAPIGELQGASLYDAEREVLDPSLISLQVAARSGSMSSQYGKALQNSMAWECW
jgi:hypothetical protein